MTCEMWDLLLTHGYIIWSIHSLHDIMRIEKT